MSLYDGIKEVANLVQKADNIELYKELLNLEQQALDMQDEIRKLKEENAELRRINDLKSSIIRHEEPYIILQGENEKIAYCANCWGRDNKLIQINTTREDGKFACPDCSTKGVFDREKYNNSLRSILH